MTFTRLKEKYSRRFNIKEGMCNPIKNALLETNKIISHSHEDFIGKVLGNAAKEIKSSFKKLK